MSIDEETRPIGTRPRIGTVSTSIFRCRSTASTTHGAPAAGRRFVRREIALQPSLRGDATKEGGVLSRVHPLLGVERILPYSVYPCKLYTTLRVLALTTAGR